MKPLLSRPRVASAIVCAVLALGLAACGAKKTADEPAEDVGTVGGGGDAKTAGDGTDEADAATSDVAQNAETADAGPETPPECTKDNDCNDNDPCTDNACTPEGICNYLQNTAICDDGDPCTQNDFCKKGKCEGTGTCADVPDTADSGPDVQPDSGDSGGGDTGPTTKCTKAEFDSTQNDAFFTTAANCAGPCLLNPTPAQCMTDCIGPAANLSATCAPCFGDWGACVGGGLSAKCLQACLQPTSQGCKDCAAKNCGKALTACSGFQAPDCNAASDCDDKNACTSDTCVNLTCTHTAVPCDDTNGCTTDSCDKTKGCQFVALPATVTCNDGDPCTLDDNCGSGKCGGAVKDCDDGNLCTLNTCGLSGDCTSTFNVKPCDDGVDCTTGDTCANGSCVGLADSATCNDNNGCTTDTCAVGVGCVHTDTTAACDDGDYCTQNDVCGAGTCAGQKTGKPCDDGSVCTTDTCTSAVTMALACTSVDTSACDDGNSCTADFCDPTLGCQKIKQSGAACDDANPATIADTCSDGTCAGAVPECMDVTQCDDKKVCTEDACDLGNHTCKHTLVANTCEIGGVCYAPGDASSADTCQICTPATSMTLFSNKAEPSACGTAGICGSGKCYDPWPPTTAISSGKACTLPACDAAMKLPFDASGNWTVTTKTVATTCNTIIQLVEPSANVGYTHTGNAHPLYFAGGCDYASSAKSAQVGTFASNVEVTCEVKTDATYGVTTVQTSTVTFGAGKGTGSGKAVLLDIPEFAGQANNSCEISVEVTVKHVPDCKFNDDCDDGIACTTDTCDATAGLCSHALAPLTCLIGGQCIADGAYKGATGSDSCRVCSGKAPSQHGWIILSNGEPCNDNFPSTDNDVCGLGGTCTGTVGP